jgi:hypothetical protein
MKGIELIYVCRGQCYDHYYRQWSIFLLFVIWIKVATFSPFFERKKIFLNHDIGSRLVVWCATSPQGRWKM